MHNNWYCCHLVVNYVIGIQTNNVHWSWLTMQIQRYTLWLVWIFFLKFQVIFLGTVNGYHLFLLYPLPCIGLYNVRYWLMYDLGFSPLGLVIVEKNVASSSSQRSWMTNQVGCLLKIHYQILLIAPFENMAITSVHGNSGVRRCFMSCLVLCGFMLFHGLHEAITFVYLLSLLTSRRPVAERKSTANPDNCFLYRVPPR